MSSPPPRAGDAPNIKSNQAVVPRKRRRRAPAAGAAEDCFTCRKRQTKCDRRRPYCSQCIELGKECSGYRTTLTWGVGVASRGKLRGLSLPVANSQQAPGSDSKGSRDEGTVKSKTSPPPRPSSSRAGSQSRSLDIPHSSGVFGPSTTTQDFNAYQPTSPIAIPTASTTSHGWHVHSFGEHYDSYTALPPKAPRTHPRPGPLQRLQTTLSASYDDSGLSASTGSLSAYSDDGFPSPADYPQTPEDFPFPEPMLQPLTDAYFPRTPQGSTDRLGFREVPRSYPATSDDMSSSISSDRSNYEFADANPMHSAFGPSGLAEPIYEIEASTGTNGMFQRDFEPVPPKSEPMKNEATYDSLSASVEASSALAAPIPKGIDRSPISHLPPSMQFLLEYYDKSICPALVAFDGPMNPYRMHVMHLAMNSEALQNAIAALSTNNIRMRRCTNMHSAQAFCEPMSSILTLKEIKDTHGEPSAEELRYKAKSVQLLNSQLADPRLAKDDSVLATLLVLCLFHVCNSGFSKFKTQLAGVQKLLSLRDSTEHSHFVSWIEMFFTWFDVMTSAVNDREPQMRVDVLDLLELSPNPGALEHLAGCEARLFKLIARLGRLNLLAQNRPVSELPTNTTPRPTPQPTRKPAKDYYSLTYDHLDGNGWGSPIPGTPSTPIPISFPIDSRADFWAEWHDIRDQLHAWSLDPPFTMPDDHHTTQDHLSLHHTSHLFHTSALLYTTRLANPTIPSSSPFLQTHVHKALHHLSNIPPTSAGNKFLLWPLFVVGTECVEEDHRRVVRWRCWEICRESGFGNNLSGLEVLERVWRGEGCEDREEPGVLSKGFWWRGAMKGSDVDGEYVIV